MDQIGIDQDDIVVLNGVSFLIDEVIHTVAQIVVDLVEIVEVIAADIGPVTASDVADDDVLCEGLVDIWICQGYASFFYRYSQIDNIM